ncbi:cytochrome c [Aquabacterium sp. NJ1]|uniref:c-type cytochrome n=1 Tax=Aquabacterium sp. NJ1 TaxID=1538295 RepID=UPI0009DEA132|nr:cytochrome c [Aquabacterium sp. NJ1]
MRPDILQPLSPGWVAACRQATVGALCLLAGGAWSQASDTEPSPARQQTLIHIVRQDCGSCHGMRLKGGLGPALTPEALADRPVAALVSTILQGRSGTPMPGWQGMLDEQDARWIAQQLLRGFPEVKQP